MRASEWTGFGELSTYIHPCIFAFTHSDVLLLLLLASYCRNIDQNEHCGCYGIKFFAAIDAHTRYPIHWKLIHQLRGMDHTNFFIESVIAAGNKVPAHVSVDGGP